jgi:diguanylate cyclase (GGDEF)-like protein
MQNIAVYTLMFTAMVQLLLAAYTWGRRNEPSAKPLMALLLLSFLWEFTYGMELGSGSLYTKIFWEKIYWMIASFGPLIFMWIVFEHLEISHLLTRSRLVLLFTPTLLTIALALSIPNHNLLIYDFVIVQSGPLQVLQYQNGILYTPILLSLQGISLVTYYFLIRSFKSSNQIKRQQSITILFALLVPFIVNTPTILGISPVKGFDFTPHSLLLTSGLFAFAIFRYRWLDIIPLARTMLVEVIPAGVVVLDNRHRIVDINPPARQILQVTDFAIGQDVDSIFNRQVPIKLGSTGLSKTEVKMQSDEGTSGTFDIQTLPLISKDGQLNGHIIMLYDITERKQAELVIQTANENLQKQLAEIESLHIQLREQAIRDPLTKLFNRGYLNDSLERETSRAERHQQPMSILMIEIDDFKRFNDTFGHEAGDVTLQQVADMLRRATRSDDIACRFGGDEFTLLLPMTTLEAAYHCAERLRECAANLSLVHEERSLLNLTLSIGVAAYPVHGANGVAILRAADKAMYHAKQIGKNKVVLAGSYDEP